MSKFRGSYHQITAKGRWGPISLRKKNLREEKNKIDTKISPPKLRDKNRNDELGKGRRREDILFYCRDADVYRVGRDRDLILFCCSEAEDFERIYIETLKRNRIMRS